MNSTFPVTIEHNVCFVLYELIVANAVLCSSYISHGPHDEEMKQKAITQILLTLPFIFALHVWRIIRPSVLHSNHKSRSGPQHDPYHIGELAQ